MAATIERALQIIANLEQELAQVRSENRYLRSKTEGQYHYHIHTQGRILRRALDDAIAFLVLQASGFHLSRHFAYRIGYSNRRYYWALGLLRAARVMQPRRTTLIVDDFQTAEQKVKTRYEQLKGQATGLEVLRLYMPKKMAYAYKAKRL